ncbi:hypothetical protein ACGFYQ_11120 [Streptomyces sp. NPDC048258]|uniref:hypothetical protein n=1 Tax=Streptomyces sp. NPDC048258 TaxID=3365527 RepID=UPI003716D799
MTVERYADQARRTLFAPARPAPAGRFVWLAAGLAVAFMLVYSGIKVYMAARGEIGMPGHPAPESVQARFEHPALAQAGNAFLGAVAAAVAAATVTRWGALIPRWMVLGALAVALVMQALGAVITLRREGLDPVSGGWGIVADGVAPAAQLAAWGVVGVSYFLRTRAPRKAETR